MSGGVFHFRQFDICQEHAAMKVGTDSDLLGALSKGGRSILDIGTGTGVLALMLAQRCPEATVTAIEIDGEAIKDAQRNFAQSKWGNRITLHHTSLQDFASTRRGPLFDSVVCNPPYFDRSLECPAPGRAKARHTSSLPFEVLVRGAYALLQEGGAFSVCLPPEVFGAFVPLAEETGFAVEADYGIKTVPERAVRRHVLVLKKGTVEQPRVETHCLCNSDRSRTAWQKQLLHDFLIGL